MLFGALAIICENNEDLLSEYGLTMQDVIKDASICSDVLYLNSFEGYEISERLNLKGFYLNKYNCVIAEVYDNKFDRILGFVC